MRGQTAQEPSDIWSFLFAGEKARQTKIRDREGRQKWEGREEREKSKEKGKKRRKERREIEREWEEEKGEFRHCNEALATMMQEN